MEQTIDVDAYFKRLSYAGGREATLQNLRELVARHTESIPFESLDPLMRLPVSLDPAALQRKLIDEGRGGYCFEHNLLLSNVLQQLGYQVTGLAARVLWNLPEATVQPRTHMLLHVELDGMPHIADVGFGGKTLTGVLQLIPDLEQATAHEPFRLVASGAEYIMQAQVHSEWRPLYKFDLQEQHTADYELMNWYTSTHPASRFVNNLIAGRSAAGLRYTLFNNDFAVHYLDGRTERRMLSSVPQLRESLEKDFSIRLPAGSRLDATLEVVLLPACSSNAQGLRGET